MNSEPIDLDSPRWSELRHAYGPAIDTPRLLRQLASFPVSQGNDEPWFTLWSSLCHQGDVYPASFAAVPHIVRILASDPARASYEYFLLPASVEIARVEHSVSVPEDLREHYFASLHQLPQLVGLAASKEWDDDLLCSAMAALAAGKGHPGVAEAARELREPVAAEFLEWFRNR